MLRHRPPLVGAGAASGPGPDTFSGMTDPGAPQPQTCYRHADRRAGVVCQRCDRPICPDCMTQASVGFHCPECVKTSSQRVYRGVASLATTPYVTQALVAINVVVYLLSSLSDGLGGPSFEFTVDWATLGEGAVRTGNGIEIVGVADGEWWRLVTGGFLHGSLLHIGFNMYLLWMLGQQIERVLGRVGFSVVYFTSLLGGSLGVMLLAPNDLTVGASGAVFGMFGFAISNQRARGINPFQTGLGGLVAINLVLTFVIPNISIGGHLGGLIGGYLAGEVANRVAPAANWSKQVTIAAVAVLGVVFAVGGVVAAGMA